MFNPGDKIRRKPDFQNREWLKATEAKELPVNLVVTVETDYGANVVLYENIGNRHIGWDPERFERVVITKPLEDWL